MSCSSVNASQAFSVDDKEQEKTLLHRCRVLKPKIKEIKALGGGPVSSQASAPSGLSALLAPG